jgi:hypothetical protein
MCYVALLCPFLALFVLLLLPTILPCPIVDHDVGLLGRQQEIDPFTAGFPAMSFNKLKISISGSGVETGRELM